MSGERAAHGISGIGSRDATAHFVRGSPAIIDGRAYGIIEDLPTLHDGVIYLRDDSAAKPSIYLAPPRTPIPFGHRDGYFRIPLPPIHGYAMVVVESRPA